jgi:cobalt/nickel transport system permease protein
MTFDEFALGSSPIHRMDPKTKVLVAVIFSTIVAVNPSLTTSAIALIFPLLLVLLARISWRDLARRLAIVNGFVALLWVFLPFTQPGEALWTWGPLTVHREGINLAALVTLKSNTIVLTLIALLGTSRVFDLVHALSHLHVPDKLVHLFFFSFRYVHVIEEEYQRLTRAIKVRGFKPGTNLHTYRTYAYLVGMLLVRSFERSQSIVAAMKCRGFKNRFYILHHYNMKSADYALAASTMLFSAGLLVL